MNPKSFSFPEKVKSLPIDALHLDMRVHNALDKAGTKTIGLLIDASDNGFIGIKNFGPKAVNNVLHTLSIVDEVVNADGDIEWVEFCSRLDITVIPSVCDISPESILSKIPNIIREILCFDGEDKKWRIIQRRYGLDGKEKLTLDQLGVAYGLSRERVRQKEQDAFNELQDVLIANHYGGKPYHVHPIVLSCIRKLADEILAKVKDFILESDLLDIVQKSLKVDAEKHFVILEVLFELFGLSKVRLSNQDLNPIWEYSETGQRAFLEEIITKLDSILSKDITCPIDEFDLLLITNNHLPKSKRLSAPQLMSYIDLCSSLEKTPDGKIQCKFGHIKGRGNQIERVLTEASKPLHFTQIVRELNKRLIAEKRDKVEQRTLSNQLSSDKRFVKIGRSGQWALSSWKNVDSSNITKLMEECLLSLNRPATEKEVFEYVFARRPVSLSSIKIYLTDKDIFKKADRTRWGLATWVETQDATIWTPDQVANFVAEYFKKNRLNEVEFKVLCEAFVQESNVTSRQARGMLNLNPVISTRRETRPTKIYAVFNPQFKSKLDSMSFHYKNRRKKDTLFQQAEKIVREVLSAELNNQMELSELINLMHKKYGFLERTAYGYISRMKFVEKIVIPDSKTKLCRMKGRSSPNFAQIASLSTFDINKADQASRAVEKLNIDDVDVGLFMCGRLFEDTLKDFMITAEATKVYLVNSANYSKLNNMIDWVKSQNILSDPTVLHFLRQERNERAHGSPPSIEERRVMLNSAIWVAGMYLDYILFFVEKKNEILKKTKI